MSFATKLCYIEYADGTTRDVMKFPKTGTVLLECPCVLISHSLSDGGKSSLPGILEVKRVDGIPTIFPEGKGPEDEENLLQVSET